MATLTVLVDGTIPVAADFNTNFTNLNNETRPVNRGGTGFASYAVGAMIYASETTTLSSLAIGLVNSVLTAVGTTAPAWSTAPTVTRLLFGAGTVATPGLAVSGDTNTGVFSSSADVVDLAGGGNRLASFENVASAVNYLRARPATTGGPPILDVQGEATAPFTIRTPGAGKMVVGAAGLGNVALQSNTVDMLTITGTTSVDLGTNVPLIPAVLSGTPVQHGLYRENVTKAWAVLTSSGATVSAFNVAASSRISTGSYTIEWDRDFADANYALCAMAVDAGTPAFINISSLSTGGATMSAVSAAGTTVDVATLRIIAIGNQ